MRRLLMTAVPAALLFAAGLSVSHAQDTPDPVPPPQPAPTEPAKPDATPTKSDPEALKLLTAAAERQGGVELAPVDAMQSFSVEFKAIKVYRWTQSDSGEWIKANEAFEDMAIDWMRNPGKESSIRTFWEINGQKVWRAYNSVRDVYWLSDGTDVTILSPGTHDADREEVQLHRRLSETLLDVAVLRKMLTDGSVWKMSDDETYPGLAVRRTPAPSKGGLTFTIWLGAETKDPRHVRVEPVEEGAPLMHYELTYQDGLPENIFSVKGAELRFPRKIVVFEEFAGIPPRIVMEFFVKRVSFNAVEPTTFAPKTH